MSNNKELIYIWDAYCSEWWFFTGDRSVSIGMFPLIPEANKRISLLTGVEFGETTSN